MLMAEECFESANCLDRVESGGFVEVMYAKNLGEATECCGLLAEQSIPACVEPAAGSVSCLGVAVLVPHNRLVEASELLAAHARDDDDEEFDDEDDVTDEDNDDDDEDDDYEDEDYEDEDEFGEEDDDEEFEEGEDDAEI
jgi:hypothetical protein